jgi:hypothetical protein
MPTATSFTVANPGYTVAPSSITVSPVHPVTTYAPAGASPSGAPIPPSGNSTLSTGSLPTATPAPFAAGAARSSGTVSALVVALIGAVALM